MSTMPPESRSRADLTSGSLPRNLLRLGGPIAAGMGLQALYQFVDGLWLSRYSTEALGAPGVSSPFIFIAIAMGFGFTTAGTALVAQHTGAGRHRDADRAAAQTILVLCVLTALLALPAIIFAPALFAAFRVPTDVRPHAIAYMRIVMSGMPVMAFVMSYGAVLRALGDTVTVVIIRAVANLVNVILDPLLIFGVGPFPELGATGAAVATLQAQVLSAVLCYVCLKRGRAGLHVRAADLRPHWVTIRRILRIGLPAALGNSSTSIGFAFYMVMVNSLGKAVLGAVTMGFRINHLFGVVARATSMAAAPIVGQALGAGKPRLARHAVWVSVAGVAGLMFVPYASLMLASPVVARMMFPDPAVVAEAEVFLRVVPISSYFFGVLQVLMAAFYGSGRTWPVMALSLMRWALRLSGAWLLGFYLGMGSSGLYIAMAAGNIVTAVLCLHMFRTGGWESAVVPSEDDGAEQS